MAEINPYLFFDGNCAEAMHYYEKALGGKLEMLMTGKDAPAGDQAPPPGNEDRIMHARLVLPGNAVLLASDDMKNAKYDGMKHFRVSLTYADSAEAKRAFDALAEGGTVDLPFSETFWSPGFGMLVDRFGTPWMINTQSQNQ